MLSGTATVGPRVKFDRTGMDLNYGLLVIGKGSSQAVRQINLQPMLLLKELFALVIG